MTKPKPKPDTAADAVRAALEREAGRRRDGLKPIEIVKTAISAYQAYSASSSEDAGIPRDIIESDDRAGLRRGTQAAVDRLLFNANYWLSAYEDRIMAACADADPDDARRCLKAIAVWNTHTLKLNTLAPDEVIATFERFCPPFALNNRRGSGGRAAAGGGKGPIPDFEKAAREVAAHADEERSEALRGIIADLESEARTYERLGATGSLDALFDVLPAWCLQDRIPLVRGGWWDDCDVMNVVIEALRERFLKAGFGESACRYFADSCLEAIDAYERDISTERDPRADLGITELIDIIHAARKDHPAFDTDGYCGALPDWLIAKEQLIWNTVVCAVYGPVHARPLLAESIDLLPVEGRPVSTDVITDLAQKAYARYLAIRRTDGIATEFESFDEQPGNLKSSSFKRIGSIPGRLELLGYQVLPLSSCYPDQRIDSLAPSEIEVLAILEHRRWLDERKADGWTFAGEKDIDAKTNPYLVEWDDLPDRVREWNRSAVRDIPALLASVGLTIAR